MNRARLLWLAVPAAGLLELGAHYHYSKAAPGRSEWAEVREPVARLRQNGELVVVAPRWAEPLARQALGDELMPLRDVARADESGYAHAVEISILGQDAPELGGWRQLSREQQGSFRLRVLENPAYQPVLFDFVDGLQPERAQVEERTATGPRPCPWRDNAPVSNGGLGGNPTFPAKRFACPAGEWFFAGVTVIDDQNEYRPRRCVWSHPTPEGPLRIRYQRVPLGRTLRGHGGMPWVVFRDGNGPPIELQAWVDGRSIGTFVHQDQDGWAAFSFETGRDGGTGDVEIEVRSASNKDRHFCFSAEMR